MRKSRPRSISISANQIREFGSSQSLWDTAMIRILRLKFAKKKSVSCKFGGAMVRIRRAKRAWYAAEACQKGRITYLPYLNSGNWARYRSLIRWLDIVWYQDSRLANCEFECGEGWNQVSISFSSTVAEMNVWKLCWSIEVFSFLWEKLHPLSMSTLPMESRWTIPIGYYSNEFLNDHR